MPTPTWREVFDDTTAVEGDQPARGRGRRLRRWRLGADQRRRPVPVPRRDRPRPGLARRRRHRLGEDGLHARHPAAPGRRHEHHVQHRHASTRCYDGGAEADCPTLVERPRGPGQHRPAARTGAPSTTSRSSRTAPTARRRSRSGLAVSNYFVVPLRRRRQPQGLHRRRRRDGQLSFDTDFRDEHEGTPCVDFNRTVVAPRRGRRAKPHSQLFVVKDALLADDGGVTAASAGGAAAAPSRPVTALPHRADAADAADRRRSGGPGRRTRLLEPWLPDPRGAVPLMVAVVLASGVGRARRPRRVAGPSGDPRVAAARAGDQVPSVAGLGGALRDPRGGPRRGGRRAPGTGARAATAVARPRPPGDGARGPLVADAAPPGPMARRRPAASPGGRGLPCRSIELPGPRRCVAYAAAAVGGGAARVAR